MSKFETLHKFFCNVLHNVDFGNGFIVQNKSIIEHNAENRLSGA